MSNWIIGLIWLASLVAVGYWQEGAGENTQKVADQKKFDSIEHDLTEQKAKAGREMQDSLKENLAIATDRDNFKTQLENERETHRIATIALERKYSSLSLQYRAAKDSGSGTSGSRPLPGGENPAVATSTPVLQLPDEITANLRQLTRDADDLNDDYRKCFDFAERKPVVKPQ